MTTRASIALCLLGASVATADTYKFGKKDATGKPAGNFDEVNPGEKRCASPKISERISYLVAHEPAITIGHDQMTIHWYSSDTHEDYQMVADKVFVDYKGDQWGSFEIVDGTNGARLTWLWAILPFGVCVDSKCSKITPEVRLKIIQRFKGQECFEAWSGDAEKAVKL